VVIAFHAGNLAPVALAVRTRYPNARIIVCADDDHHTPGNPGLTQAQEACGLLRPLRKAQSGPPLPGLRCAKSITRSHMFSGYERRVRSGAVLNNAILVNSRDFEGMKMVSPAQLALALWGGRQNAPRTGKLRREINEE